MATTGIIALGAITAALVAGFFSFLNLIISKEQKVSEFRQEWIDSLRADVAQYISAIRYVATANALWSFHSDAEENGQDVQKIHWHEHWVALKVPYDNAARAYSSIFLRINTNDIDETTKKLNLDFLHKLKEVRDAVRNDDYDAAAEAADELNELVKPILKLEWERVKAGEAGYRWSRNVAIGLLLLGLSAIGSLFFGWFPLLAGGATETAVSPIQAAPKCE